MTPLARVLPSLLLSSCLALAAACSHNEGADAGASAKAEQPAEAAKAEPEVAAPEAEGPAPEAKPEGAAPAGETKVEELSFVPNDLSDKDGKLEHCLDCRRKSARYNYCLFDKDALAAAVGADNMAKTVTAKVEMVEQSTTNSKPDDPNLSAPEGGFNHVRYACTVTEVISAE